MSYQSTENNTITSEIENDDHLIQANEQVNEQVNDEAIGDINEDIEEINNDTVENNSNRSGNKRIIGESTPLIFYSPDDPIVSVLNLPTIQLLFEITKVLVYVNFTGFLVTLISQFFIFNYLMEFKHIIIIFLSGVMVSKKYWKFPIFSFIDIYITFIIAVLILLNIFMDLKWQEIWSNLWFLFMVSYTISLDYYINICKINQEIKYTGRPEPRMTISQIFISFIKIIITSIILLLTFSITLFHIVTHIDLKSTDDLITVNNINLHLKCYGSSTNNTILIESGLTTSSESYKWVEEMYQMNEIPGYCTYDRPGYGTSDFIPTTFSSSSDYLSLALSELGVNSIMIVAFDIGGLYAQVLSTRGLVNGIMFVDSWHPDLILGKKFPFKEDFNSVDYPSFTSGLRIWWKGLFSPLGLVPLAHLVHPHKYTSWTRTFGSDMKYQPKYLLSRLSNYLTSKWSYNEVPVSGSVKTVVVSSDGLMKGSKNWSNWQREISQWGECKDWVVKTGDGFDVEKKVLKRFVNGEV